MRTAIIKHPYRLQYLPSQNYLPPFVFCVIPLFLFCKFAKNILRGAGCNKPAEMIPIEPEQVMLLREMISAKIFHPFEILFQICSKKGENEKIICLAFNYTTRDPLVTGRYCFTGYREAR